MYQRDYILRMIEMISKLIAGILGLIKGGKLQKASEEIQDAYHNFLKEDAVFFQAIPKDQLTHKLLHEHNYTNRHLEILAELMFAEAELNLASGNNLRSLDCFEKALILLEFIQNESKTYSVQKLERIDYVRNKVNYLRS